MNTDLWALNWELGSAVKALFPDESLAWQRLDSPARVLCRRGSPGGPFTPLPT